jgi:hypothetical protein
MTYIQFQNIVEGIGRKLNWDLKVILLPYSTAENASISEDDFPLYKKDVPEDRVFRMSDAVALQNMANS